MNPLSRDEWDFGDCDQQEVLLAFEYEYSRSSDVIKTEVAKMRAASHGDRVWMYCPRENPHYEIIHWLAEREQFPEVPWLTLRERAIERVRQRRKDTLNEEKLINEGRHPRIKLPAGQKVRMPTKLPDDSVETGEWMCCMFGGNGIKVNFRPELGWPNLISFGDYEQVRAWREKRAAIMIIPRELERFKPQPQFTMLEWALNWYYTDQELKDFFSDMVIRYRPHEFKRFAKKGELQRSHDGALYFRRDAALRWLGVLRRRNAVKTWREFFELYPDDRFKRLRREKKSVSAVDLSEIERARIKDCQQAKSILAWFNGAPLNEKDFK